MNFVDASIDLLSISWEDTIRSSTLRIYGRILTVFEESTCSCHVSSSALSDAVWHLAAATFSIALCAFRFD